MSAYELLTSLNDLGVRLWVEGDGLRYSAPKGALTPDLVARLRAEKADLIAFLRRAQSAVPAARTTSIPRAGRERPLPLSYAQQRLWFLSQLGDASAAYNIPLVWRIKGPLDTGALARALAEIVRRHEALRTIYVEADGAIAQVIAPAGAFPLEIVDLEPLPDAERDAEARRIARETMGERFDLGSGLLLRARLMRLGPDDCVFAAAMGHIAIDGWSVGIFLRELATLYGAYSTGAPSPLPQLEVQYADYAAWERAELDGPTLGEQLAYWRERLAGAPRAIDLPTDRPRPEAQTFRGAMVRRDLDPAVLEALRGICRRMGATPFAGLLAAYDVLLARYAETDDVVVGSPIANRNRAELEPLLGFFANTLVLRSDLSGDPSFLELVERVRRISMDAYARQDVPFERLVEELSPERDPSRNPLTQVLFVLQNAFVPTVSLPGLEISEWGLEIQSVRFDFELHVWESVEGAMATFMYNSDLFDRSTVETMAAQYESILRAAVASPETAVSDLAAEEADTAFDDERDVAAALGLEASDTLAFAGDRELDGEAWRLVRDAAPATPAVEISEMGTCEVIEGAGATIAVLSHAALRELVADRARTGRAIAGLRMVVALGGPIVPGLARAAVEALGCRLVSLYVPSSSAGAFVNAEPVEPAGAERRALGRPVGLVVAIHDAKGRRMAPGPFGELAIGPGEGSLRRTGLRARRRASGVVELAATPESRAWIDGRLLDLSAIEGALLGEPSVAECVARVRETGDRSVLAIYVVPAAPFASEALVGAAGARARVAVAGVHIVPVTAIPRDGAGRVDERELENIQLADETLAARWEAALAAVPGVERAAVVVRPARTRPAPLHVSRLLRTRAHAPSTVEAPATTPGEVSVEDAPLAVSDGGPLEIGPDAPATLTEAFRRTAASEHDREVVYVDVDGVETTESYAALYERARRVLAGLRARGLGPGSRAVIQAATHRDHFAAFWGCVLAGVTPVTVAIPPSYGERNAVVNKLFNAWELLGHPPVLASASHAEAVSGLPRVVPMDGVEVLAIDDLLVHEPSDDVYEAKPEDVLFIQLSSGSTGVPKCIQVTHTGVVHHVHGSRLFCGYGDDEVTLNWLPMDHVVPVLTCLLKDVYLGYRHVAVATGAVLADPLVWLDLIERHRATLTWAPNFGFKLVADALRVRADRVWDLSSIKYFMNAGEQVTVPVVREFLRSVERFGVEARTMQPAFGMAEACTCMTYQTEFALETGGRRFLKTSLSGRLRAASPDERDAVEFVDLGGPVPGVQVRIADAANRPVPEGVIGRMQIKGAVITPGYLENDEANREAFVGEGWFNSGDLGFILDGRLTLTGREKEIIIVNGANLYCYEVEDVVNEVDGVEPTFSAACGFDDPATGTEGLAIFFVPRVERDEPDVELVRSVRAHVTRSLGVSPAVVVPLPKAEFPKTTSGKIQRTAVKKRLAAGDFGEVLESIDVRLENERTVPNWFHRSVWRRAEHASAARRSPRGAFVVFLDEAGVGEALCARLEREGATCVRVFASSPASVVAERRIHAASAGTARHESPMAEEYSAARARSEAAIDDPTSEGPIARIGERRFCVAAGNMDVVRALFDSIEAAGMEIGDVVHLWGYGPDPSEDPIASAEARSPLALVAIARALAGREGSGRRITIGASRSRSVLAGDALAPARAAAIGLAKTIPQEIPELECAHVDLEEVDAERAAATLAGEIFARELEAEVAVRAGRRYRPRLERVAFDGEPGEVPIEEGGLYLVTGGLGGIGVETARLLLDTFGARLLLVGRRPLAERPASDAETLEMLARRGEVRYEAVDVADIEALEAAVARAEAAWDRPLAGVFHTAGVFREAMIAEETAEGFASALRPKVAGTHALLRLLESRPRALFVAFSSVNGFFGGVGVAAYSAANSALEAFVAERARSAPGRTFCFNWTLWEETGMSRGYAKKELSRARGYHAIPPAQGLRSLLAGLSRPWPILFVGLDAASGHVARHTDEPPLAERGLTAYVIGDVEARIGELEVSDALGARGACEVVRVDAFPLTLDGEVDREALAATAGRTARRPRVLPRTEIEERVAEVFRQVLGLARVGVDESFFELGGHSLLAVRLVAELRKSVGVEMPVDRIVEAPTIARIAGWIEERAGQGIEEAPALPDCILALQPRGTKAKFFCVHPASGSPICFARLAEYLGTDRPFYGFQSPGLLDEEPMLRTVDELAELYVDALRTVQPRGPYLIGGWSSGGPVAFEMARRLEAQGERVSLLALIDSGLMHTDAVEYGANLPAPLGLLKGLGLLGRWARQIGRPRRYADLRAILQMGGISLPPSLRGFFKSDIGSQARTLRRLNAEMLRATRVFRTNTYAGIAYEPRPYGGTVTALRTRQEGRDLVLEDLRAYAREVEVVELSGNHISVVLGTDDTRELAVRLGACIDRASGI